MESITWHFIAVIAPGIVLAFTAWPRIALTLNETAIATLTIGAVMCSAMTSIIAMKMSNSLINAGHIAGLLLLCVYELGTILFLGADQPYEYVTGMIGGEVWIFDVVESGAVGAWILALVVAGVMGAACVVVLAIPAAAALALGKTSVIEHATGFQLRHELEVTLEPKPRDFVLKKPLVGMVNTAAGNGDPCSALRRCFHPFMYCGVCSWCSCGCCRHMGTTGPAHADIACDGVFTTADEDRGMHAMVAKALESDLYLIFSIPESGGRKGVHYLPFTALQAHDSSPAVLDGLHDYSVCCQRRPPHKIGPPPYTLALPFSFAKNEAVPRPEGRIEGAKFVGAVGACALTTHYLALGPDLGCKIDPCLTDAELQYHPGAVREARALVKHSREFISEKAPKAVKGLEDKCEVLPHHVSVVSTAAVADPLVASDPAVSHQVVLFAWESALETHRELMHAVTRIKAISGPHVARLRHD